MNSSDSATSPTTQRPSSGRPALKKELLALLKSASKGPFVLHKNAFVGTSYDIRREHAFRDNEDIATVRGDKMEFEKQSDHDKRMGWGQRTRRTPRAVAEHDAALILWLLNNAPLFLELLSMGSDLADQDGASEAGPGITPNPLKETT